MTSFHLRILPMQQSSEDVCTHRTIHDLVTFGDTVLLLFPVAVTRKSV